MKTFYLLLKRIMVIVLISPIFSSCSKVDNQVSEEIITNQGNFPKTKAANYDIPDKIPSISWDRKKVRAKETTERIYGSPKNLPKMAEILRSEEAKRIESNRKKTLSTNADPTVKTITFTATDYGAYYVCYAEANYAGPFDFYLINTNTWVYEYVGSSSGNSLYFYVDKPSLPGNYKVWYEGPNESNMTPGTQFMGVPYSGITVSGGIIDFASQTDYDNLMTRLEQAVEDHEAAFFSTYSYMTDDQLETQIDATGFDEDLPLREFEGYFGITSLRASIAAGEQSYLNGYIENDPDDETIVTDEIQRAVMNTSAELKINGLKYDPYYYYEQDPDGQCRVIRRKFVSHLNFAADRKTKTVVEFSGIYFGTSLISKTKYYKKKSNGNWKKYPGDIRTQVGGTVYLTNCFEDQVFSAAYKPTQKRRRVTSKRYFPLVFRKIISGSMGSVHDANGVTYGIAITW